MSFAVENTEIQRQQRHNEGGEAEVKPPVVPKWEVGHRSSSFGLVEVEHFAQKLLLPLAVIGLTVFFAPVDFLRLLDRSTGLRRALDDLVELSWVLPDTAALRAVVDCHALPVRHLEFNFARWAVHSGPFPVSDFLGFAAERRVIASHAATNCGLEAIATSRATLCSIGG